MAYRTAVVGGSGYTGGELLRLLATHPGMDVACATADSNAGAPVARLHPGLRSAYSDTVFDALDPAGLAGFDVVFLALPHGASQEIVPALVGEVGHVVDLGADFRTPEGSYETWYGGPHHAPGLLDEFVYGLPEIFRREISESDHVAVPGCYPTAAALALAPLLDAEAIECDSIIVDAASGVSGRGRGLSPASLYSEASDNFSVYGLLDHRHTGEMEYALGRVASRDVTILFTPHLAPMPRGILATCYARPTNSAPTTPDLMEMFRDFYADEPFIEVVDEPPGTKATLGSNAVHLTARADPRTGTVLVVVAEDNLVKGAAGQAVQCANLVLGLDEPAGLTSCAVAP